MTGSSGAVAGGAGRPKIAICDDYERHMLRDSAWQGVQERAEVVAFHSPFASADEAAHALAPFDAVCLVRERLPMPASLIARLPRLRFIAFTGERNLSCDHVAAARRGIPVSTTPGGPSKASTAETAWALILAGARRLCQADAGLRAGHWRVSPRTPGWALPAVLEGERLGVVGLGQIGERVARVGTAFGMEVVAWSPNLTDDRAAAAGVTRVGKAELFATSRAVSLHLVHSARTSGVVGPAELASMRADAVIVNTARAGLMPEAALLAALDAGRPGHAALDVFETEPLPSGHALLARRDVTLSPHLGYVNGPILDAFSRGLADALLAWLDGRPVRVINAG